MGRGDKKTAKGKRTMGSYGNTRKRASEKVVAVVVKAEKVEKVVKAPAKKTTKKETVK
jgi:30S ribosomal protein S31